MTCRFSAPAARGVCSSGQRSLDVGTAQFVLHADLGEAPASVSDGRHPQRYHQLARLQAVTGYRRQDDRRSRCVDDVISDVITVT